jgi:uncharacterized protein (DUF1015 family)
MKILPIHASIPKVNLIIDHSSFVANFKEVAKTPQLQEYYEHQDQDGYYIYEILIENKQTLSLVCFTSIEDVKENRVLKHEDVLMHKTDYLLSKLLEEKFFSKPVMMFLEDSDDFENLLQVSIKSALKILTFDLQKSVHNVYKILADKNEKILEVLNRHQFAFIADGHHRYKVVERLTMASLRVQTPSGLFSAYLPQTHLTIKSYHRSIRALSSEKKTEMLNHLKEFGTLIPLDTPRLPKESLEIIFHFNDQSYSFNLQNSGYELTVSFLDQYLLRTYLSIMDKDVVYIDGNFSKEDLATKKDTVDNFYLYPICIDKIKEFAKAERNLPPKSTWFEPKLRSGIILADIV